MQFRVPRSSYRSTKGLFVTPARVPERSLGPVRENALSVAAVEASSVTSTSRSAVQSVKALAASPRSSAPSVKALECNDRSLLKRSSYQEGSRISRRLRYHRWATHLMCSPVKLVTYFSQSMSNHMTFSKERTSKISDL